MKKYCSIFLFFLLTCLSFTVNSQTTVTIGTGTSSDYNFPIQPYFNYGWSSYIYTATEIGNSGTISSLAFYINNSSSSSYTLDNQKIYIRQTSNTHHDDKFYPGTTGFTLVYSGSITVATSGWKTITLSTPFTYSNTSNIELLVESRDGSTFTSTVQGRYTSKSEYRTKFDYNDYSFPSTYNQGGMVAKAPNIQFTINTCAFTGGTASASSSSVCSGGSSTLSLTGNSGTPIQWQSSNDNTTFTDITGATSSTYIATNLTATKYYRAKIGSGTCIVYSSSTLVTVTANPTVSAGSPLTGICQGATSTSMGGSIGGGATSGTWTGGVGIWTNASNPSTATYTASALESGTITLTLTTGGGSCGTITATKTISVTATPSAGILSGTTGICTNGSSTFSSSISGGTWTSETPAVATIVSNTGVITGITAGSSVITYTITGTGGCSNAIATRTVIVSNPVSSVTMSGTQAICQGSTTTLTASTQGGTWSSATPMVATINALGVVTGLASGTSDITYTIAGTGGCSSVSATKTVTVNSNPTSNTTTPSNISICRGESVFFTSSTLGANETIQWQESLNNTSFTDIQGETNTSYTAANITATKYVRSIVRMGACTYTGNVHTISVLSSPTNIGISATQTTIASGESTVLTASGATNYTWDHNQGTGSTITVSPTGTTTYTLTGNNGNSCTEVATITITVNGSVTVMKTVQVGTLGNGADYSNPYQNYFNYGWSSQLYLANEINNTGKITSLSYYVTNSGESKTLDNQKVYVRHTNVSSYESNDKLYPGTSGFALVYEGSITFGASGWNTITFATPFSYNGTDNLEVLVESRDASTTGSAVQTRYTNQSGTDIYRTKYNYNDNNFPSESAEGLRIHHFTTAKFTINTCTISAGTVSSSVTSVCSGGDVTLTAANQTAGQNLQWQFSTDDANYTSVTNQTATTYTANNVTSAGYYRVQVGSGACVVNSAGIKIETKLKTPILQINNYEICQYDEVQIGGDSLAGYQYTWENIEDTSCVNCSKTIVAPDSTRTYKLNVISNLGCIYQEEVVVKVNENPKLSIKRNFDEIKNEYILEITGANSYSWFNDTINIEPFSTSNKIIVSPEENTTYKVEGKLLNGCSDFSFISLIGIPLSIETKVTQISKNSLGEIKVTPIRGKAPFTYIWNEIKYPNRGEFSIADITDSKLLDESKSIKEGSLLKNLSVGTYHLKIIDSNSNTLEYDYYILENIEWIESNGVNIINNTIEKTNPDGWNNSILISKHTINYTENSKIFLKIDQKSGKYIFSLQRAENAPISKENILFGIFIDNENASIINNGVEDLNITSINNGSVIGFEITDNKISYIINGLPYRTYEFLNQEKLVFVANLHDQNTSLSNASFSKVNSFEKYLQPNIHEVESFSFNTGAIEILDNEYLSNATYQWTGPNNFESNKKNIDSLMPGTYSLKASNLLYNKIINDQLTPIYETVTKTFEVKNEIVWNEGENIEFNDGIIQMKSDTNSGIGFIHSESKISANEAGSFTFNLMKNAPENTIVGLSSAANSKNSEHYMRFYRNGINQNMYDVFINNTKVFTSFFEEGDNFKIEKNKVESASSLLFSKNNLNSYSTTLPNNLEETYLNIEFTGNRAMLSEPTYSVSNSNYSEYDFFEKNYIKYVDLKENVSGAAIYLIKPKLYFKYKEEYAENTLLNYVIYEDGNVTPIFGSKNSTIIPLKIGADIPVKYGDNFLVLDLCQIGAYDRNAVLEITTSKNEKLFLRFNYVSYNYFENCNIDHSDPKPPFPSDVRDH